MNPPKPRPGSYRMGIPRGGLLARFRTKLILLILLLVVPVFGLALHSNFKQRRIEKQRTREGIIATARLAAATQEQFIRNARQLLATLADLPFLALTTNSDFCQKNLSNLIKLAPDYLTFGLVELDGTVFCSASEGATASSLGDRSYVRDTIRNQRFSIGEFQVGRLTGEPSLNFGHPVFDENGNIKRVIFAALQVDLLSQILVKIPRPEDATISVYDRNGTVLARHPHPEKWVGTSARDLPLGKWFLKEQQGLAELPGLDGVSRLHAVTCVTEMGQPALFVSLGVPVASSFAHANEDLITNCIILAVLTLGLIAVAWLYSRNYFLHPIGDLVTAAERIAGGDLSTRVNLYKGVHELTALGTAFDAMAATLEERQKELKRAHDAIAHANALLEQRVSERTTELRALNEELEAFSYSVSHDLRAPLRHISGFVSLLTAKATTLDDKGKRYLSIIAQSAQDMGRLIDDLLAFSRMSRAEMRTSPCNLTEIAEEIARDLTHDQSDRLELKIERLPLVYADTSLMRQVMLNLISNAIKYSRTRERAVIEVASEPGTNGEHIFFVRDNGVGFDMKYADKLFGVFQRLHDTGEFEGTGIGLAIVQRIIARHGGRTWAHGTVGQGATFYFSLPNTNMEGAE